MSVRAEVFPKSAEISAVAVGANPSAPFGTAVRVCSSYYGSASCKLSERTSRLDSDDVRSDPEDPPTIGRTRADSSLGWPLRRRHDRRSGADRADPSGRTRPCVHARSIEQDDTGVIVTIADGSQDRADYVSGCDGIRSFVRDAASIPFPGVHNPWSSPFEMVRADWCSMTVRACPGHRPAANCAGRSTG
ncbi:MAG TPA: FAD-dependent monooxygenase [Streptosporangiaceae bacterium]|nr:FAD-dependent monooxygenase [Streptosporangiaceae bacterium]